VPGTLVFYESPKRVAAMLRDAALVLGGERQAAVCRELTKKFEEVLRGTLDDLATLCSERPLKGEVVVLVDRGRLPKIREFDLDESLMAALAAHSVRDAADMVAAELGLKRRQVYQRALDLDRQQKDDAG
jgi:16S rRNA (cytidine1402-2'-O)-methyltransferase